MQHSYTHTFLFYFREDGERHVSCTSQICVNAAESLLSSALRKNIHENMPDFYSKHVVGKASWWGVEGGGEAQEAVGKEAIDSGEVAQYKQLLIFFFF